MRIAAGRGASGFPTAILTSYQLTKAFFQFATPWRCVKKTCRSNPEAAEINYQSILCHSIEVCARRAPPAQNATFLNDLNASNSSKSALNGKMATG